MLPVIVVGLVLPVVAAALLGGAAAALAAGALTALVVVLVAARLRYDEPIEVATAHDARYHLLVVATVPVEEPGTVETIGASLEEGRSALGTEGDPEVLVLAPALNTPLAHWVSDLRGARLAAQERLAVSLGALASGGISARGEVGDTDPVQATEDVLRSFPAQEVIFVTEPEDGDAAVGEIRRRLDRPLRHLPARAGANAGN